WSNYWLALDQVGDAVQRFAQQRKHQVEKKGLGLPRNIPNPRGTFQKGKHVNDRHASPVHFHFGRDSQGLVMRVLAFPAAELPDLGASTLLLNDLLAHLKESLPARFHQYAALGQRPPVNPTEGSGVGKPLAQPLAAGDRVRAVLLEERTKAGGWKA